MKQLFVLFALLCAMTFSTGSIAADTCSAFAPFHSTGIFQQGRHFSCSCDSCHKGGIFKGTPSSCKACHVAGGRASSIAPATHIPTGGVECASCHATSAWNPANMQHSAVNSINCDTCHNGSFRSSGASGKDSEHITTTLTCSTCHKSTNNWDATFTHQGVVPGTCSTCHNGSSAKGKNATHIPTSTSCDSCHLNYNTFSGAAMNHVGITGGCETCHNGVIASGKTATHPSTPAACITCHTVGNNWICKTGKLELYIKQIYTQLREIYI
jgi:hypothetical protein